MTTRCLWAGDDPLMISYHDNEWGVPMREDKKLFELLMLEGAQAGLSWQTVLNKRENYRKAFAGFDPDVVVTFGEAKVEELMQDAGIIRNRRKIEAVIANAKAYHRIVAEFGSFHTYIWSFVGGQPLINHWATRAEVPNNTPESDRMSRDLKKRGFKFVGITICYAFMQSAGMVMDHTTDCFRYPELSLHITKSMKNDGELP